ncbi:hypothetical protein B842_08650 [Corynebacterium humireducens NBRC 106098 = DSM 45392]|uniref:Oxidoreductase n=1 Tax=Corynebacterium humireducens NBRC 106098 = DSM 45392 TaxID=1223515 RepID=A0A0B5DCT0_9CORY|nr:hypothetical protein [Corynebacterium humireducens]AJE33579.1 hypothetical protein B842_08650 [Corynebacterium humireducens NBRC 106098 = DSM 45392]
MFSRVPRIAAALGATALLALTACTSEQPDPTIEAAVGLPVDAARITVVSTGATGTDARVLTYADVDAEQSVEVEVAEGFNQLLMRADTVDVQAPAGGDVTRLTVPLTGATTVAGEAVEGERPATRDVEFRVGRPAADNLELTDDIRSAEGFLLGWRAGDAGDVSTVRLAAPKEATDEGRALVEKALMKLLSLPVVFPEEAVGEGATWSVDTRVTGESTLLQTATYTITGIDGDRVDLDVSVQQRPALGALEMEDGQSLNVLNSNTTSEGTLTVDLGRPLPVDGRVSYTTRVIYGGADSDVRVVQDSTTSLAFADSPDS